MKAYCINKKLYKEISGEEGKAVTAVEFQLGSKDGMMELEDHQINKCHSNNCCGQE